MVNFYSYFLFCFICVSTQIYAREYQYSGGCRSNSQNESFEECLENEVHFYDMKLGNVYKRLLKGQSAIELKKVEDEWVKYKESDCDFMASRVNGGLYYQFIYNACIIKKTKIRISELERTYLYSDWFDKGE